MLKDRLRRGLWEGHSFMSKTLLVLAVLLLATVAAVAATTSTSQPATGAPAIRTYLMPDFSLKSVISPALHVQPATPQTENLAAGPKRHGTCRCSCGFPCTSSADCDGSSCDPFITCCERKTPSKQAEWLIRSFDLSSHQTPMPEAIVKANCK